MDPIATARYGMMAATRRLEASATQIAGGEADPQAMAGLAEDRRQFTAQVRVVEIADEMWRALLGLQARPA